MIEHGFMDADVPGIPKAPEISRRHRCLPRLSYYVFLQLIVRRPASYGFIWHIPHQSGQIIAIHCDSLICNQWPFQKGTDSLEVRTPNKKPIFQPKISISQGHGPLNKVHCRTKPC